MSDERKQAIKERGFDIYEKHVTLKKEGSTWVGLCPFHDEKSGSFKVDFKKGEWVFFCHGGCEGGDVFDFLATVHHLDTTTNFPRLLEIAKESLGPLLQEPPPPTPQGKTTTQKLTVAFAEYKHTYSPASQNVAAMAWLTTRGITGETANRLKVGFAQTHIYTIKNETNRDKGWITFPRVYGDVVRSIKFRSIAEKDFSQVYGMENSTWFNHDRIEMGEPIFTTEGEPDACVMEQAGFRAVSVPSGGKHNQEMKDALKIASAIYIAGDNDGGVGSKHVQVLSDELAAECQGTPLVYRIIWPGAKDANEYFLKVCGGDGEKFKAEVNKLIAAAVPVAPKNGEPSNVSGPGKLEPISHEIEVRDMPRTVLSGRLGEIIEKRFERYPIAYAWTALLTGASLLVPRNGALRTNLNTALVGPVGSGKSAVAETVKRVIGASDKQWLSLKAGSAEGLATAIGDRQGGSVLVFPDELSHMMDKGDIKNSSFMPFLTTAFYETKQTLRISKQKEIVFNASMSTLGGVVEENYGDVYGYSATAGFRDRTMHGQCPQPFILDYRPDERGPETFDPKEVWIDNSVWEEKSRWAHELKLPGRVPEIALRAALICASIDGQKTLKRDDLAPFLALARHEALLREYLQPNKGITFDGMIQNQILGYLRRHAPDGEWVTWKRIKDGTNIDSKYGGPSCDRILQHLVRCGDLEMEKVRKSTLIRLFIWENRG